MNIQPVSTNTFRGYDARHLRGFIMSSNSHNIATEMLNIGKKEGFEIFTFSKKGFKPVTSKSIPASNLNLTSLWAQDYWTVAKNKLFIMEMNNLSKSIMNFFNLKRDYTENIVQSNPYSQSVISRVIELFADSSSRRNSIDLFNEYLLNNRKVVQVKELSHISGGNLFLMKGKSGDELLVGEDEVYYNSDDERGKYSIDELKSMYGVDKVTVLPQMDFHLDLFIRPLDNKRILLADDSMTSNILLSGLSKFKTFIDSLPSDQREKYLENYHKMNKFVNSFINTDIKSNTFSDVNKVFKKLEQAGYDVIRFPGRIYRTNKIANSENEICLTHFCNYMNANALKNKDDKMVYITNKSDIDEKMGLTPELAEAIGFSFEQSVLDELSKYIDLKHVYLVSGDNNFVQKMLTNYQGGIHCVCSEVP